MSVVSRWLGRWRERDRVMLDDARWVVVDVESSGLNATRDRLIAIAGVAVHRTPAAAQRAAAAGGEAAAAGGEAARGAAVADAPRIALGDSFEVVLRHEVTAVDKHNILLHGIGVGAQRDGLTPRAALEAFEHWVGPSPLIAFHCAFDETMIGRAMDAALGRRLANPWVDLEPVAAVARPDVTARSLDEWMAHFGIRCMVRHQAASDTLATAELLLQLWPAIQAQTGGRSTFKALQDMAAQRKWLAR